VANHFNLGESTVKDILKEKAPQKLLDIDDYVVVNIWTSEKNKALSGANVGHVSLQTKYAYMSLWPGKSERKPLKTPEFFQPVERAFKSYFGTRPSSFKPDYETDCALEGMSDKERRRNISDITKCKPHEKPYLLNNETGDIRFLTEQPRGVDEKTELLLAITPHEATVRLVLYGLNADKLLKEFEELKNNTKEWKLTGSSSISRSFFSETAENCASLVYRCLSAGGLYNKLISKVSSTTSSIVTPDELLRHIVAYKEKELNNYPKTKEWKLEHVDESDLKAIKQAYEDVGKEANVENDILPIKDSPGCMMM
jgi:hypothetical protein